MVYHSQSAGKNMHTKSPADELMHIMTVKAAEALNASHAGEEHHHDHLGHHHDHGHGDENQGEVDIQAVLTAKTVTMITLCVVSLCMGIVPMQIARCCKLVSAEQVVNPRYFELVVYTYG